MAEAFWQLPPDSTGKKSRAVAGAAMPADVQQQVVALADPDGNLSRSTLTKRLGIDRDPAAGYRLWLDTADASYLYVLEAPAGHAAGDIGFRGVRFPKDVNGNPLGQVQENASATLTFANRTTDGGWA